MKDHLKRPARLRARTAVEQTVDFIRRAIEQGTYTCGDRLPAERDLAQQVGVSRPTVRAALRSLAAMGIVQVRHGSGTFVADGPATLGSQSVELLAALHGLTPEQILETRRALEVSAAELAAEQATPEQIAVIADEVTGMFASTDDAQAFRTHDVRFHQELARASGNPLLAALVDMVSGAYFASGRQPAPRDRDLREVAGRHHSIYLAVRARDPERARKEMGRHLPKQESTLGEAVL